MNNTKIKICGLTRIDAIKMAMEHNADFLGFVFFPKSPRHLSVEAAADLMRDIPEVFPTVAVTVNPDDALLEELTGKLPLQYIQLHGSESPERVAEIKQRFKLPVIKAITIQNGDDIAKANSYEKTADMLLFDAKVPDGLPGGNGLSFDWMLLKNREFALPWFLSGGLNNANIADAIRISGAQMVDVSSSLEIQPGVKEPGLIRQFIKTVQSL